jgi:hypothetical protein
VYCFAPTTLPESLAVRASSILLSPLLLSCASAAAPKPDAPTPASGRTAAAPEVARSVNLETKDGRLLVAGVVIHQSSDTFRGEDVDGAAAKLWTALPAVYDQLGLPVNGVDTEKRAVAAVNFRARVQLARVRLSQYVDCGAASSIGRAADSYTITFNVATQVVPISDARATVATLVQAFGRPSSNAGEAIHCTSTGILEARVAQLAAAHVAP